MNTLQRIPLRSVEGRKQAIDILYQDAHLLVVNKPSGLRVIPDRWDATLPNLRDILMHHFGEGNVWVVHRIDAETSGVVVFARTAQMHRELNRLFEKNAVEKIYLGIVQGCPPDKEGRVNLPIRPHPTRKRYMQVHPKGKPSITDYRVLETFGHFSLLEIRPRTGRTHQIRVHLQAIRCPLAVDSLYGTSDAINIRQLKKTGVKGHQREDGTGPALMHRLSLHAYELAFTDPLSGEERRFQAPIPRDFQALLKALRKWDVRPAGLNLFPWPAD